MLPRIKILQVGDIHLVRTARIGRPIDDKDCRFPTDLRQIMAAPPIKTVFRTTHRLLARGEADALLFMGDFSERGDLDGFDACISYLAESLELGEGRRFAELPLGLVPGNHDVDRALATKPGLRTKFQPLQRSVQSTGLPSLPVEAPVWLSRTSGSCRIDIALLNSCWGCGSKEFIPEEFRDEIMRAIDAAIADGVDDRATEAYYDRQLDTPAFSAATIQKLVEDVAGLPGSTLLVACAHHNLLPQHVPRLAPYTELVNAGVLRSALLDLSRPVIYLHGHIHEDPVEIVHTPSGGPLVCISAPEASEGFNMIEIVFTRSGLPLVCYVRPWRFETGVFKERAQQAVPLSIGWRKPPSRARSAIYQKIVAEGDCYWPTLVACVPAGSASPAEDETEEAVETLAADRLIIIENYALGRKHWSVRARL